MDLQSVFSTPGMLTLLGVLIIMSTVAGLAYWFSGARSTDRIKARRTGDGQFGSARFATEKEKRNTYARVVYDPAKWRKERGDPSLPQGIVVGTDRKKGRRTAVVDPGDVHALMIGAAGVGKTAFFLYPNLEYACASGMSFLATDTKGDLYRKYGEIAQKCYGYRVSVLDLRNPTRSDSYNFLSSVSRCMDRWKADPGDLASRARAEKYAKIIAKTIVRSGEEGTESAGFGQNAFFYDAAEGLLTAVILLVAEFARPEERHIVSVFRVIQELMQEEKPGPGLRGVKGGKKAFAALLESLPETHKARWFSGAAMYAGENAMNSVMSTAMSRLNSFLDSELEQIICFDGEEGTAADAESFIENKTALFVVLPEEDNTKYFLVSLLVQQLYRELLVLADEREGKLPRRTMFYLDEFGTIPKIASAEMMFSASRSRRLSIVAVIQSFAQLERNYGREGSEIITDNTQLTVFGGFAPLSAAAEKLSSALGKTTVTAGSVTLGNGHPSRTVQMTGKDLLSADEMKVLPKGTFLVAKTGCRPMTQRMPLFAKWGIVLPDTDFSLPERASRPVTYAGRRELRRAIEESFTEGKAPDLPLRVPRIRPAAGKAGG